MGPLVVAYATFFFIYFFGIFAFITIGQYLDRKWSGRERREMIRNGPRAGTQNETALYVSMLPTWLLVPEFLFCWCSCFIVEDMSIIPVLQVGRADRCVSGGPWQWSNIKPWAWYEKNPILFLSAKGMTLFWLLFVVFFYVLFFDHQCHASILLFCLVITTWLQVPDQSGNFYSHFKAMNWSDILWMCKNLNVLMWAVVRRL